MRAPAKINLTLEVLARRDDGYHGIRSVMVPLELADEADHRAELAFSFACDRGDLEGERNLALAALRALGESPPVRIELRKRIPVQAGLGGGSSDAAAVLRAAMAGAFGASCDRDWLRIARALGSDVPFFLAGTAALVEGTGERITPAGAIPRWHALIVKPPVAISTADAYAAARSLATPGTRRVMHPFRSRCSKRCSAADFAAVESLLQNDFHDVIAAQSAEVRHRPRRAAWRRRDECDAGRLGLVRLHHCAGSRADRGRSRSGSIWRHPTNVTTAFAATPDWRASPSTPAPSTSSGPPLSDRRRGRVGGRTARRSRSASAGRSQQGFRRNRRDDAGRPRSRGAARGIEHRADRRRCAAANEGSSAI